MKKIFFQVLLLSTIVTACGPKIYKSADFGTALAKHKIVAILPADVTTELRPNQAKKISAEQIADLNSKTGYEIQDKMYSWFLRKAGKQQYTVTFQDVTRTNALLKQNNISYEDLASTDRAELAKLLGVDAVLQDKSHMEKPMSEAASATIGLLVGVWGNTNKVNTTINIHDGKTAQLLWKYDYEVSGSVGSSPTRMVDALMKNAAKKFPYSAK